MKAEELMIGDWVNVGNDEFAFPDQIYSLGYDEVDSGHGDMVGTYRYDELFPIPITPEILEKNGFVKQGFPGWEIYTEDFLILWRIRCFNAANGSFHRSHISYVHELQHALRLCGIKKEIML